MRLIIIFFFAFSASGQGLPSDWLGSYSGNMEIFGSNGAKQNIGVRLDLQIMDRENYWTYNMSYFDLKNNETVSTKAYKIFYSKETNTFWTDEGDSLLIEMSYLGNCFFDHFELSGMFFNSSLCKENKDLIFTITGGKKKPSYTSPFIKEAESAVETMHIDFLQRVLLKPMQ